MATNSQEKHLNALRAAQEAAQKAAKSVTTTGTSPLSRFSGKAQTAPGLGSQLQRENALLKEQMKEATVINIDVNNVIVKKDRMRYLTEEQFDALSTLIPTPDSLLEPIVVYEKEHGSNKYELISGHNRLEVFKNKGFSSIKAVIIKISPEEADKVSFIANLNHYPLTDYEMYKGLQAEKERTNCLGRELAQSFGISTAQIAKLFSFGKLPKSYLAILDKFPHQFKVQSCYALVKQYERKPEGVWESLRPHFQDLCEGRINIKAFESIYNKIANTKPQEKEVEFFTSGGTNKAKIKSSGKRMVFTFQDQTQRILFEKKILELLKAP